MIVRTTSDLPSLDAADIILDFETSSGHTKVNSLNPWGRCRIAGTGITSLGAAGEGKGWYLTSGHIVGNSKDGVINRAENQLDPFTAATWTYDTLQKCSNIYGHNLKYDLHVLVNNWQRYYDFDSLLRQKNLIDTMSWAKLVDSDRFTYALKPLGKDWLDVQKSGDELEPYLKTPGGKTINVDYGQIDSDVCGRYCVQDLIVTAALADYCRTNMMSECDRVWETERKITKILWKIERNGMRLDLHKLEFMTVFVRQHLSELEQTISEVLAKEKCSKVAIRPAENTDCYEVLCSHYGLPVLEWTAGGKGGKNKKPSFNKSALKAYLHHPKVIENENLTNIVKMILKFRKWDIINNMFLTPYNELHLDGLLHGDFNQIIRTGRMSMRNPNMQQCPKEVRGLIVPYDQDWDFQQKNLSEANFNAAGHTSNECIVSRDASQIEFRLIAHYIKNRAAIDAYRSDPNTDYHQLMADRNNIPRDPAKNINFMLSFSGGKYKTLSMLKDCLDLLGSYDAAAKAKYEGRLTIIPKVVWKGKIIQKEMRLEGFDAFCWFAAVDVYEGYHRNLPELKKVSWKAQNILKERGWVKNLYGRVRKLPVWASNKTFNNLVQSSAADLLKERIVAFDEQFPDVRMIGLVHDEVVTSESKDQLQDEKLQGDIMNCLCSPAIDLDVPILWNKSVGDRNWRQAK